jgi:hypothetical protein
VNYLKDLAEDTHKYERSEFLGWLHIFLSNLRNLQT